MQHCYILPITADSLLETIQRCHYLDTLVDDRQLIEVASYVLNITGTEEETDFEDEIIQAAGKFYNESVYLLMRKRDLSQCYMSYIVVDRYGTVFVTLSKKVISCPQRLHRTT